MYWTFYNSINKIISNQNSNTAQNTQDIFKALVDSIIPRTPRLAEVYAAIMYYGALDLLTYEYVIMSLDYFDIPLAQPMAELLDVAAERLLFNEGIELLNDTRYPRVGAFAALSPDMRFRALTLLEGQEYYSSELPMVFRGHPELVLSVTSTLNRLTMMGYYSEWFGYGTTRLNTPNQRILEFSPLSWTQVGYPGPSFSYRAEVIEYYQRRKVYE